ncbi:MAG: DUF3465 domain-containing protein [Phycisphaerales bacterium]
MIAVVVGLALFRGRSSATDPASRGDAVSTRSATTDRAGAPRDAGVSRDGGDAATRSSGGNAGARVGRTGAATEGASGRATFGGRGASADDPGDDQRLGQAIAKHESSVWVQVEARVAKLLPDDTETPKHQRFLVEIVSGDTLLVAHNIDVAARVPVKVGETITIRGRYEWSDKGGLLHFTHRDSDRGRPRGWIEAKGKRWE